MRVKKNYFLLLFFSIFLFLSYYKLRIDIICIEFIEIESQKSEILLKLKKKMIRTDFRLNFVGFYKRSILKWYQKERWKVKKKKKWIGISEVFYSFRFHFVSAREGKCQSA